MQLQNRHQIKINVKEEPRDKKLLFMATIDHVRLLRAIKPISYITSKNQRSFAAFALL